MEKKLRIGIIGTGGIANAHVDKYLKLPNVEIVAGADIVPGKARAFLDRHGLTDAKAFDNHKDLLEMDLDGVSVCTYNTQHAPCVIDALEKGVHVLCEKPMSVTLEEAVEMRKAELKSGKILTIGFQPRYGENMKMIKDIVQGGELGKVYYVQTGGGRRRGIPGRTFIEKKTAGVGVLADIGCYGLDMALNTIGYPKPLTVSAVTFDYFGKDPKIMGEKDAARFDVDDFAGAFIRLEGGITIDFRMSWAMHMDYMGDTMFLGTDAGLKVESPGKDGLWGGAWDGDVGPMTLFHDVGGRCVKTALPSVAPAGEDKFYLKIKSFVDSIVNGDAAPIPTSQIIYNQAIIDGIRRSAELGKEVDIVIPEI